MKATKADIITAIADKTSLTKKQATEAYDALADIVTAKVAGGEAVSLGFGTLKPTTRAPRNGVVPGTGERRVYPGGRAVKFTAAAELKRAL